MSSTKLFESVSLPSSLSLVFTQILPENSGWSNFAPESKIATIKLGSPCVISQAKSVSISASLVAFDAENVPSF